MFDFDPGKFLIIGVVALLVIGPKELPRVMRQVGQAVGRMRRMASEFQGQFMDAMREADLEAIRGDLKKLGDDATTGLNTAFDPARDIQRELSASLAETPAAAEQPLDSAVPAATDHFTLPSPEPALALAEGEPDAASASLLAAGVAPVAADDEAPVVETPAQDALLSAGVPGKKRKIILPKRRTLSTSRSHAVFDRTALPRPARWRQQEMAGR